MSKHQKDPKGKGESAKSGKPFSAAGKLSLLACACFFCKAVSASADVTLLTTGRPAQGPNAFALELVSQYSHFESPMAIAVKESQLVPG